MTQLTSLEPQKKTIADATRGTPPVRTNPMATAVRMQ
jgi:hypothetical protein